MPVRRALLRLTLLAAALFAPGTASLSAQGATQRDLRASQLRLDSIKQQREQLQRELRSLQSRVRDASRELENIGRQRAASVSALQELEFQAAVLETSIEQTNLELNATQQRLASRSAALRHRLRAIYKRGPLHTVRVLLSAESFGELLRRYRYLQQMTAYDRVVLDDVKRLNTELTEQEQALRETFNQMEALRSEKSREVSRLEQLEQQSRTTLNQVRRAETRTSGQIAQAERDEAALVGIIDRLERERLDEERRRASGGEASAPASIATRDLGTLAWPVEGTIVYRFGPDRKPNGITLTNNGIGIGAPAGTPVRAVEAGTISHAGPFAGYGAMVMINHGGGYYTLYMYLKSVSVREGETIAAGAVIGTVGGEQTPEGAHIEFQVRAPIRGNIPEPVDPLAWLRSRSGG